MLLSLLPLAGWAEAITEAMFIVTDVSYGTTPTVTAQTGVTYTQDTKTYKKVGDAYVETTASDLSPASKLKIGTYYLKFTGTGTWSGEVYKPFIVSPKVIKVKFTGYEIEYGATVPTGTDPYAYSWATGFAPEEADVTAASGNFLTGFKYGETGTETDVKRNAETNAVEAYPITATCTDSNYELKYADETGGYKITPKNLTAYDAALYTFTVPTGAKYVYNGQDQTNLPTIAAKLNAETPLTLGKDYNVVWYKSTTFTEENKETPKYAAVAAYYAQVEGTGNYTGNINHTTDADATKIWKMAVAKKDVIAYVEPLTKTYTGVKVGVTVDGAGNANITDAKIVVNTLCSGDEGLKSQLKAKFVRGSYTTTEVSDETLAAWNTAADAPVNYISNGYPMKAYAVEPATGTKITDNYNIDFMEVGALTIAQRKVTVTAKKQTAVYTGSNITINSTITTTGDGATVAIEAATATSETGVVDGENITSPALFSIALKTGTTLKEQKNYPSVIEIKATEAAATSNYEIVSVAGDFEVTGKALKVIASTFDKEYGYVLNAEDLTYLTNSPSVTELAKDPVFTVTNEDGEEITAEDGVLPRGTYTITITPDPALAPANYTIAESDYYSGTLTVTTKALKATVAAQSLSKGDGEAKLLQGGDYIKFDGLVGDEKVKYTIKGVTGTFNTGSESTGGISNAITVELTAPGTGETGFYNDNYTLAEADITKGKLFVYAENTVVLSRDEADLVNFIKANKGTAANQTVNFASDRAIAAEAWNSFVLPFAVKVADLSKAVGYCLVNVLDTKASKVVDGKGLAYFKIEMQEIPANTPFLMKTADGKAKGTYYSISNVKIVEANPVTVESESGEIKFIPLYEKTAMGSNDRFPVDATETNPWKKGGEGVNLKPLASYIEVPEGAEARIFVQDLENGTTVIKQIGVEGIAKGYNLDGWYTLQGVKLQGAPTEKGVYINNGKKVVIK